MPFSARQGFTSNRLESGFPNWPTQATSTQFTAETSQYGPATIGSLTFGNIDGGSGGFVSQRQGALRAPNGNIYFLARGTTSGTSTIQEYDPSANSNTVLSLTTITADDYRGGSLGGNGNIYLAPHDASGVYEFDPVNRTSREISASLSGSQPRTHGAVTDKTGNVFCISDSASDTCVKVDCSTEPVTISTTTFNSITGGLNKYATPALHPNGNIYCMGGTADHVLELDPVNLTHTEYGTLSAPAFSGNIRYSSTVIGVDSCIYGVPFDSDTIAKFDPSTNTLSENNYGASIYRANAFNSASLTPSGDIFMVPHSAQLGSGDSIFPALAIFRPQTNTISLTTIGLNLATGASVNQYNGIACDESNVYLCARANPNNLIVSRSATGGQNANAFTLSAYTNNSG